MDNYFFIAFWFRWIFFLEGQDKIFTSHTELYTQMNWNKKKNKETNTSWDIMLDAIGEDGNDNESH